MVQTMNVMVLVIAVVASVLMLPGTEAAQYTVGDELGWTIPPGGAATYAAWAAKHSLVVNDFLAFNFKVGEQDLALVTKADFDSCNTADPLAVIKTPGTYEFISVGTYYLTCTYAGHCSKGQKIALYFAPSSAVSPTPSSTPSPSESQTYDVKHESQSAVKFVSKKEYFGFKKLLPVTMKHF